MLRETQDRLFLTRATPGTCGRQTSNWLLCWVACRWLLLGLLLAGLGSAVSLTGQTATTATNPAGATVPVAGTKEERLAALHLEMTNAYNRVLAIVNQVVPAYRRVSGMRVSTYNPGWFHEGAAKPDFNTVDVRQSQDLHYAQHQYVTSDLNPGLVFRGQDLEFNSMTKYFYTNRTLPKHKLSEAEMLEINRLYRIIGRCEGEICRLEAPVETETTQPAKAEGEVIPGQPLEKVRRIPKETRMLYGGIGIGVLVALLIVFRLVKKAA